MTMNKTKQPNLLFIMDDQHRFDYLGSRGAHFVKTPHLDRLAARGINFSNCFTNSPLCAPSRIALATGMQPGRVGALDNNSYLPPQIPTFYQRFRDNGYRVGCVGKLDLAKPDLYNGRFGDRPCAFSFGFTHPEECEGKMHAGVSPTPLGPYGFYLQEKGLYTEFHEDYQKRKQEGFSLECSDSVLPTEAFEDVYIGNRAAEWIRGVPDDFPWFYFVSFVGPHDPFDPPTEYAEKFRDAEMPLAVMGSLEGKPGWVARRRVTEDQATISKTRRQYCAAIHVIDDQVGKILDALERRGMLDNTYIIFTSDHGEMAGDHGLYTKSVAYEPAIHVPLIIAGPGIAAGGESDALVELIDLNPTACGLAGIPDNGQIMDAKSLDSLLFGQTDQHRTSVMSCENNFRCLRTDRYKYIQNFNDAPELYDLQADREELHNIAPANPALVAKMQAALARRWRDGSTYRDRSATRSVWHGSTQG